MDPTGVGSADGDARGRALRPSPELRHPGRRGQISRRRGRLRCLRPRHVHPRWLRLRQGIPRRAAVARGPAAPQRAILAGDGPQLHLHPSAETAPRLLRQRPPAARRRGRGRLCTRPTGTPTPQRALHQRVPSMTGKSRASDFDDLYHDERTVDGLPASTRWDIGRPQRVVQQFVAHVGVKGQVLEECWNTLSINASGSRQVTRRRGAAFQVDVSRRRAIDEPVSKLQSRGRPQGEQAVVHGSSPSASSCPAGTASTSAGLDSG